MKSHYKPKTTNATEADEPRTTSATKAKKWVLVKPFEGEPKDSDLQLTEEDLPEVKDGEILMKAVYLSVDPYMRPYVKRFPAGITMIGSQVSKVIESKHKDYPVGCHVLNHSGWRTAAVFNPDLAEMRARKVPDLGSLSLSLTLGALGMPGTTAYFGMEVLNPKEGETLLVSGAAGAVGSLVGQIGKIKGLRVVGCAGTNEKCKWLKELGFDYVFNYKTADVGKALKEGTPNGVDCYFDNVGGDFSSKVIHDHMTLYGRVSICGSISGYNDTEANIKSGPYPWPVILFKELKVEGFIVSRFADRAMEALTQMGTWMAQGEIEAREHMTDGFDNMRSAFYGMLKGENTGKAVVKA